MGKNGLTLQALHTSFGMVIAVAALWLLMQRLIHPLIKTQHFHFKILNIFMSIGLAAFLGAGYANLQLEQYLSGVERKPEHRELIVYVAHLNELGERSIQQKVQVLNGYSSGNQNRTLQYLVFIPVAHNGTAQTEMQLGQYYRLSGELRPAHGYATAGAFDQERWYAQQNISSGFKPQQIEALSADQVMALGFYKEVKRHGGGLKQLQLSIEKLRLKFRHFLQQQPLRHKGLLLALLTGDESLLDQETKKQFQRFGMSHLLAISGPHVVIFAMMVSGLIQFFIARYRPQLYLIIPKQYLLIIPFICCVALYCVFAGFEIPAVRTLLMCCLGSAIMLLQQKLQPLKLLLLSAAILLLIDPFSILSAAFWLSYGACFILLRVYQTLQKQQTEMQTYMGWKKRLWLGLQLLVESQWKIFLALFPLMILFFKQVSWITPLSNIVAIPWLGLLVVPLDIIAAISYGISEPLAAVLFYLNDQLLGLLLAFLDILDHLFNPKLSAIAFNSSMLILLALSLLILFSPRGVLPRAWAALGVLALCLKGCAPHPLELTVLDVGQGQAIFLREQQHAMMVDMGGNYDEEKFSVGRQIILPFLAVNAVSELDQLVLTHLDQDHSGGYLSIRGDLPIHQLIGSEQPEMPVQTQFQTCDQGQRWQLSKRISIEVLSPTKAQLNSAMRSKNENSCVLYVQLKDAAPYQNFLLMGDAGWETEFDILQRYPDLKVDVLILGHHGSQHSSAYGFLKGLKPKLAIASAGKFNRYGHPSKLTQARLQQLHIPLWVTSQQGTIQFIEQQGKIQTNFARDQWKWLKN